MCGGSLDPILWAHNGNLKGVGLVSCAHISQTETQVKVFESDIPLHTNQNIGIF